VIHRCGEWWHQVSDVGADTFELDYAFWQSQSANAIFSAAWEMVVTAHKLKGGGPDELRLQRTDFTVGQA